MPPRIEFLQGAAGVAEVELTESVELEPTPEPMEEGHTKISFEPGERAGHRRLTGAQLGRGVPGVLGLAEHDEPAKRLDVHDP